MLFKLEIFVFVIAFLNMLREGYKMVMCYRKAEFYDISDFRMFGLWSSIAYIMTIILSGF